MKKKSQPKTGHEQEELADEIDVYVALSHLDMPDVPLDLGGGATLIRTHATFRLPLLLMQPHSSVPGTTGFLQFPNEPIEIRAQLHVKAAAAATYRERLDIARLIVRILRLWADPAISLFAVSSHPLADLALLPADTPKMVRAFETRERSVPLHVMHPDRVIGSLGWVRDNWQVAWRLYKAHSEFRLAMNALDEGHFLPDTALALVSLWGALEAIFSVDTRELKFRVSSNIASYLHQPGTQRLSLHKRIMKLYDARSGAAHGAPRHGPDEVLATFELLRSVVLEMIRLGKVPTREDIERRLFGITDWRD